MTMSIDMSTLARHDRAGSLPESRHEWRPAHPALGRVIIALSNLDPMSAEHLSDFHAR